MVLIYQLSAKSGVTLLALLSHLLFLFFTSSFAATKMNEKAPLILGKGEQRLLNVPGLIKYSLGSSVVRILPVARGFTQKLAQVNASESLLLKAVAPGYGDLWVWKKDGTSEHRSIQVKPVLNEEMNYSLARLLETLEET